MRHLTVGLSHYGLISQPFDALCKAAIELLKRQSTAAALQSQVCAVIAATVKAVSVNDATEDTGSTLTFASSCIVQSVLATMEQSKAPNPCSDLCKALANALVTRGPQLSILSSVHGQAFVQLHSDLLAFWAQKLAEGGETAARKRGSRSRMVAAFKGLSFLLTSARPKDAIAM